MRKLFITMGVVIILASCDNNGYFLSSRNEMSKLRRMVNDVGAELSHMGFPVDLSEVHINVLSSKRMAKMFNEIGKESRGELLSAFGFSVAITEGEEEKHLFDDGTVSRLAFFDPNSKTLVFLRGSLRKLTKGYLAHELAHVYQDQKWGFDKIWTPFRENSSKEIFNITQFMIEGHAELVRQAYEHNQAKSPLAQSKLTTALGKIYENDCSACFQDLPPADLPYSLGMRFLVHQYRHGGWPSVEKFFDDPPASTEQMIHWNKQGLDKPTEVSLPEWNDAPSNAELVTKDSMGEAFLLSKLLSTSVSPDTAFLSASGWDGDAAHLYRLPNGAEALAWRIVFDRVDDALQAEDAILSSGDNERAINRTGRVLDWVITDSPALENSLRIFLSKHPESFAIDPKDEHSTSLQEMSMKSDAALSLSPYYQPKMFIGPNL